MCRRRGLRYVEAGAFQTGFPDDSDFATSDYTNGSSCTTQMQGYSNEWWFDLRGFAGWSSSDPGVFPSGSAADQAAAANIAAGLGDRFYWCALEVRTRSRPMILTVTRTIRRRVRLAVVGG